MTSTRSTRAGLAHLGVAVLDVAAHARGVLVLGGRVARRIGAIERRETAQQAFELANRSAFFVTAVMGFVGAIMVLQACIQAQRVVGDLTTVGPGFLQLLVREFAPTIVALMIAARYGAGVAAELGAMAITEQIDALRLTGATPEGYLVGPRIVGGLVGMLPVVVLGAVVAYLTGAVAAWVSFSLPWDAYYSPRFVTHVDLGIGLAKTFAYGVAVPLVSAHAGLVARGGAPGVGRATTVAVIGSSLAVLLLDLAIGGVGHFVALWEQRL